jgi:hypothetical protein
MKNRSTIFYGLLILILATGFGMRANAQSSSNPDTVCVGASGEVYYVNGNTGSTYDWEVTGTGNTKNTSGSETP